MVIDLNGRYRATQRLERQLQSISDILHNAEGMMKDSRKSDETVVVHSRPPSRAPSRSRSRYGG